MKASLISKFKAAPEIVSVADPGCPSDGVIVEIEACGVCRSDWHGWMGTDPDIVLPHVGGHEFAGIVVETGSEVRTFSKGDRVTAPFILSCGTCPTCRTGEPTICDNQHVLGFSGWGGFAQLLAVPHADFNLVRLPEAMNAVIAAGLGCRVTTAYRALTARGGLNAGEWVAVHGAGGVGLSAVMLAKALDAKVLAVDVNSDALALARQLGANAVVDASITDRVGDAIREATGGGAQLSVDAMGIADTFANSVAGLAKLGRHIQVGMPVGRHAEVPLKLLEHVYSRQISILGSRGMAANGFPPLFDLIATGRFNPAPLITRRIHLSDIGAVFEDMSALKGAGIVVVDRFD